MAGARRDGATSASCWTASCRSTCCTATTTRVVSIRRNALTGQAIRYRAAAKQLAFSLSDVENMPDCRDQMDASGKRIFNPVRSRTIRAAGTASMFRRVCCSVTPSRRRATCSSTCWATTHFKLGFDFEDNLSDNTRKYTGTDFDPNSFIRRSRVVHHRRDGIGLGTNRRGFALPTPTNQFGDKGVACRSRRASTAYDYFRAVTETRNYALYLRDSWNLSFLPGLVLNAGPLGNPRTSTARRRKADPLLDNLAPRVGLPGIRRRKGRSKIYAQYGRFYQSVPMDINDRSFSGEGLLVGRGFTKDRGRAQLSPTGSPVAPQQQPGSTVYAVGPARVGWWRVCAGCAVLKGQFLDEVVAGAQYDLGLDIVVGAYYP